MSASLVGSEMCIRDRRGASWLLDVLRSFSEAGLVPGNEIQSPLPWKTQSCLLYTSDAADDM
eukprot:13436398-Alexandrium_andersonii.AAC.1